MGGDGSSRWLDTDVRPLIAEFHALDVRRLARDGGLAEGARIAYRWRDAIEDGERGRVMVRCQGDELTVEWWPDAHAALAIVPLAYTTGPTGGRCPWFRCPACRRRAARLYLYAWTLACRRCLRLSYLSEREDRFDLAARRARKARMRLGLPGGDILAPLPRRPRGMHYATWSDLRQRAVWADLLLQKALIDLHTETVRRWKRRGFTVPDWLPQPAPTPPAIEAALQEMERAIKSKRRPRRRAAA